jgi:hypothetical protein
MLGATGQEDRWYFGVAPMRLSTAKIQNSPPQKKTVRLFDGRGLYLEIAPTGSRWWRFKYRFAGKEKRISLGVYPDVGLKNARDRRDEMRRLVADGIDPSAARKQEKLMALDAALNTFEAVAREWTRSPPSTTGPCRSVYLPPARTNRQPRWRSLALNLLRIRASKPEVCSLPCVVHGWLGEPNP